MAEWIKQELLLVLSDPKGCANVERKRDRRKVDELVRPLAFFPFMVHEVHNGDVAEWSKAPHC